MGCRDCKYYNVPAQYCNEREEWASYFDECKHFKARG